MITDTENIHSYIITFVNGLKSPLVKKKKTTTNCYWHKVYTVTDQSSVVGTVFGKNVVDLWILDGAKHQSLPVVSGPVVQVPHPHPGKVHSMGVQRL